jgi:hypothetical protein
MSRLQPRSAHELIDLFYEHLGSSTLWPERAHQLFDELLCQPASVPVRKINGLFAALRRPPPRALMALPSPSLSSVTWPKRAATV